MARLARVVVPGLPHHVTQRGNGREQTFFSDDDYLCYRTLLAEHTAAADVAVWAWVAMPGSRADRSGESTSTTLMST